MRNFGTSPFYHGTSRPQRQKPEQRPQKQQAVQAPPRPADPSSGPGSIPNAVRDQIIAQNMQKRDDAANKSRVGTQLADARAQLAASKRRQGLGRPAVPLPRPVMDPVGAAAQAVQTGTDMAGQRQQQVAELAPLQQSVDRLTQMFGQGSILQGQDQAQQQHQRELAVANVPVRVAEQNRKGEVGAARQERRGTETTATERTKATVGASDAANATARSVSDAKAVEANSQRTHEAQQNELDRANKAKIAEFSKSPNVTPERKAQLEATNKQISALAETKRTLVEGLAAPVQGETGEQMFARFKATKDRIDAIDRDTEQLQGAFDAEVAPAQPVNAVIMVHPQHGEITEADIQQTMEDNQMTREDVIAFLGRSGAKPK